MNTSEQTPQSNELLTKREVAAHLRVDVRTLDRYISRKEIAVVKMERMILIKREDLMAFVESRRVPAVSEPVATENEASE